MHRFYEFMLNDKFNIITLEFRGTVGNKLALCECTYVYVHSIFGKRCRRTKLAVHKLLDALL